MQRGKVTLPHFSPLNTDRIICVSSLSSLRVLGNWKSPKTMHNKRHKWLNQSLGTVLVWGLLGRPGMYSQLPIPRGFPRMPDMFAETTLQLCPFRYHRCIPLKCPRGVWHHSFTKFLGDSMRSPGMLRRHWDLQRSRRRLILTVPS